MENLPGRFRIYRILIGLSLFLTLLTVVLSAYIRLAEVGIGCETWPDCYAQLTPAQEKKGITVLTEEGSAMAHYGARVAHRYVASILGLFIVAMFFIGLRLGSARKTSLWIPGLIFGITVFLSLLGYYTPTRSNPLITMGNLLGGMGLLALLWWLWQRESATAIPQSPSSDVSVFQYRPLAVAGLTLVLMQVVLGGWGSANYASANCPGLVSCSENTFAVANLADAFNPLRSVQLDETGQVVREESLGLISMLHRLFAFLTVAYLVWMARRLGAYESVDGTLRVLSVLAVGQLALGVSMIWLELPLLLVTLHNTFAAGLILSSVNMLHLTTPALYPASPPAGSQSPG
jgi:heme a synthase